MADWYEFGSAKTTPHIHAYSGGDCHLKTADGTRYDLIKRHVRVPQAQLNGAFDHVRADFPLAHNATRVALLAKLKDLLRNVKQHHYDMEHKK